MMAGLLLIANSSLAQDSLSLVMVSDDGPPHMIAKSQSGIDIAKAVLSDLDYQTQVAFASLKRGRQLVINKQADLFLPTFFEADKENIYLSNAFIQYRPTVFTRKQQPYSFEKLTDIKNLRVATFQGATGYFGKQFVEMTSQNYYREFHDMSKLPELLIAERVDIVVLDHYIFYYYLNAYIEERRLNADLSRTITSFALIPPVSAYVGFNNANLRDEFNRALAVFLADERDRAIIEKYIGTQSH